MFLLRSQEIAPMFIEQTPYYGVCSSKELTSYQPIIIPYMTSILQYNYLIIELSIIARYNPISR